MRIHLCSDHQLTFKYIQKENAELRPILSDGVENKGQAGVGDQPRLEASSAY